MTCILHTHTYAFYPHINIYIYLCVLWILPLLLATWWFRMCLKCVPSCSIGLGRSLGMAPFCTSSNDTWDQEWRNAAHSAAGTCPRQSFRLLILSWYWHVNPWGPVARIFAIKNEVRVVGLPQCGMFMDQPDYTGKPSYTPLYANIFNLMGAWVQ